MDIGLVDFWIYEWRQDCITVHIFNLALFAFWFLSFYSWVSLEYDTIPKRRKNVFFGLFLLLIIHISMVNLYFHTLCSVTYEIP